jgi:hypothetical protein
MAPIELPVPGTTLHGERRESRYEDAPPAIALHAGVADSRSWSAMFNLLEGVRRSSPPTPSANGSSATRGSRRGIGSSG